MVHGAFNQLWGPNALKAYAPSSNVLSAAVARAHGGDRSTGQRLPVEDRARAARQRGASPTMLARSITRTAGQ